MGEQRTQLYTDRYDFRYNGKVYYFTVQHEFDQSGRGKAVLLGKFLRNEGTPFANEALPEGLEFETVYCLKASAIVLPISSYSYPQERQFWDFFPFEGENLRQVLALNDDAQKMVNAVTSGELDPFGTAEPQVFNCAVLEPLYLPFNIDDFPTCLDKIDCMLQIIAGLRQLMQNDIFKKHKIVAHRDLKFNNVMVEKQLDGSRRMRIIDFPSLKFNSSEESIGSTRTQMGFLSPENTAPENVLCDLQTGYNVTAKTDVFALGTMLAEIFKIWDYEQEKNPLALLFDLRTDLALEDVKECARFYMLMNRDYPFINHDMSGWLENSLANHDKNAAWDYIEMVCPEIRRLFRAATAIKPANRITLNNFEDGLKKVRNGLQTMSLPELSKDDNSGDKIMYFLVDTTQIKTYIEPYATAMQDVVQNIGDDVKIAVLAYDSIHIANPLQPDTSLMVVEKMDKSQVVDYVKGLPETPNGVMFASTLKKALHNLLVYLGNKTNRIGFNDEIHIFTPFAPSEENACRFSIAKADEEGVLRAVQYGYKDILNTFANETDRIYVHTFNDDGAEKREDWYTLVSLSGGRPVELPVSKTVPTSEAVATPEDKSAPEPKVSDMVRKRGLGFYFIGGIPKN